MSLYSFASSRSDGEKDYLGFNEASDANKLVDELLEDNHQPDQPETSPKSRTINLILDHSAFVRGFGNIKRWFNDEYFKSNLNQKHNEKIILNMYIPSYTLHEFDYAKKGNSMMATNAREAIRFIDKIFESDGSISETGPIIHNLTLESPKDVGPSWEKCHKWNIHTPKIKEFPNFKTKFDSNLLGQHPPANGNDIDDLSHQFQGVSFKSKTNEIQYENSASYQKALSNSEQDAEMPVRLRYLIRSCIQKRFIEKNSKNPAEQWKLVTEDSITNIWARSYGIDCLNVNEVEVLMFQNHDVNSFKLFNPHNTFSVEDEYQHESNILHSTIDTTQYSYTTSRPSFKNSRRKRPKKPVKGVVSEGEGVNGEHIKKERFDAINYAPRGKGQLWKPQP